jgi:UDP-glucose-4-epimerase GalE
LPSILVTGGAGYIGSFAVRALLAAGHRVVVFDDLSEGHREAVGPAALQRGDLRKPGDLRAVLASEAFDAVFHFAASCLVPESVANPGKYRENNVTGTGHLLDAMRAAGVRRLVFSSTAAVYGDPAGSGPLREDHPRAPVNPYGATKAEAEDRIAAEAGRHGLRHVTFRYFNAAGADPEGGRGEDHRPETHLVPFAVRAALGLGPPLEIFGDDYPTPDGSAIRDYVHVRDIARAHVLGLDRLLAGGESLVANLGTGKGNSVREVVREVEAATGRPVPARAAPRRAGDPAILVADGALAEETLGFRPEASLREIIRDVVAWTRARPDGYRD